MRRLVLGERRLRETGFVAHDEELHPFLIAQRVDPAANGARLADLLVQVCCERPLSITQAPCPGNVCGGRGRTRQPG
jgi:hypothetical protein